MASQSLADTLHIDCGGFNQWVVNLRIPYEYCLKNVHEFTNKESNILLEKNYPVFVAM